MSEEMQPGYRVTLRDVHEEVGALRDDLAEVRVLIAQRLPEQLDERLREVEESIGTIETRLDTIEASRAPRVSWTAIVAAVVATVAVFYQLLHDTINK